jgi:hypothetical protein
VTFSEPVAGVDPADFAVATTGVTGASITAVTGFGDTYTVSIQTGSGDGTIRLDLLDDDSILDATGNPLGSPGIGNGDFIDGEAYTIWYYPTVTSIVRADPDATNATAVDFTVTFSEPVIGVGTTPPFSDFVLTTTGVAGVAITAVTGFGDTYTVSIQTGSGDGTIRLNLLDDDSIRDANGNPLGSPGISNGDFVGGEYYIIWGNPRVISIVRADTDPPDATSVDFTVTFSEPVNGVDMISPFADFALTSTKAAVGKISAVSGFGATYTVTISLDTHAGNGTVRLDVVDNDSIVDSVGDPLGGVGIGNGNFTSGESYTVLMIPQPLSPAGRVSTELPTYEWIKVSGATRYRIQLSIGPTKIVSSEVCGSTVCSIRPTTWPRNAKTRPIRFVGMGSHKWRVQAQVDGVWAKYSEYQTFTVSPKAGYWESNGLDFTVTTDLAGVADFTLYIYVNGCGYYSIHRGLVPIENSRFSFQGDFYASGAFSRSNIVSGKVGLKIYYLSDCGYITGGPFSWMGTWTSSTTEP